MVAVDRPAGAHRFDPALLLDSSHRHRGSRGNELVPNVLAHADRRAGSPLETRPRVLIVGAVLPQPEVRWVVQDDPALAGPDLLIGIEDTEREILRRSDLVIAQLTRARERTR